FEMRRDIRDRIERIKERKNRLRATPNPEAPCDDGASDEAVDFRNQSAFVIVHRGDVIGTVTPETDGTDGVDVRGVVISAKKGRSLPITINDSLRLVGEDLVAQISGVLRVQLDKIIIEPVLGIKGDVDFETGNIDFPGGVDVSGGVKDHFVIRAGGEVTVHKLVEAAEIHGRGDVVLSQGMAGREMGRLVVGGDLRAGYLDGVEGEIRGCLRVAREIKECRLRVQRRVDAPESTVYGGRLEARQRIDLGVIGGPGGVFTEVMVGGLAEIETLAGRLARLRQSVDETRRLEEAELAALQMQIDALTPAQTGRMSELQSARANRTALAARVVEAATRLLDAAGNWSET
ncbi:MAG: FapA family protein, partial [Phycisphaerales bacterium]|nr:FapA family protein [Phycisphaerales bacterium]